MVDGWGFGSLKLKGGVLPPEDECEAIEALRDAFPSMPLRLDPNGAWTPETSLKVAARLAGVVEYLEDPTPGIPGMAQVAAGTDVPLATNMCVIAMEHLPPAIAQDAVQVVLSDHHLLGRAQEVARCSAASPRSGAWGCRCTATPTSASRSPRWCTSPPRRRTSPTPATPTTPGRPRTWSPTACCRSSTARSPCRRAGARRRARPRQARRAARALPLLRRTPARGHRLHALHPAGLRGQHLPLVIRQHPLVEEGALAPVTRPRPVS